MAVEPDIDAMRAQSSDELVVMVLTSERPGWPTELVHGIHCASIVFEVLRAGGLGEDWWVRCLACQGLLNVVNDKNWWKTRAPLADELRHASWLRLGGSVG